MPMISLDNSGLEALKSQYQAVTQNVANSGTAGYKRRATAFSEVINERLSPDAEPSRRREVQGRNTIDLAQGPLKRTGNPLNVAIEGDAFFALQTPNGTLYTRDGDFTTNAQGQLSDADGRMVAGQGGPIMIPSNVSADEVTIGRDGTVSAGETRLGRIRLVTFEDPQKLTPVGGANFAAPEDAQPSAAQDAQVKQGYKEGSNVETVEEMTELISVSRLYQAQLRAMQTESQRLEHLIGVLE